MVLARQRRRVAQTLVSGHSGRWQLPMWFDRQNVGPVGLGADFVQCQTNGFDFVAGGRALLWADDQTYLLVEVDEVLPDRITLSSATTKAFPNGARLYPVRAARLQQVSESEVTDGASTMSVSFAVEEPCDWPAVAPVSTYLGYPVWEMRPERSNTRGLENSRIEETVDNETGLFFTFDLGGQNFTIQGHPVVSLSRAQRNAWRSSLYWLRGRSTPVWVPTWGQDLQLVATASAGATQLDVAYSGLSLVPVIAPRQDIRIHKRDGSISYHRITNVAAIGDNERLVISPALPYALDPSEVRAISFMAFCTQATDTISIEHITDTASRSSTSFQAVKSDV